MPISAGWRGLWFAVGFADSWLKKGMDACVATLRGWWEKIVRQRGQRSTYSWAKQYLCHHVALPYMQGFWGFVAVKRGCS
jgi:hypothetical protein